MIKSSILTRVKRVALETWIRLWAIRNLERTIKDYGSDDTGGNECPIMTQREANGLLSLTDVLSFVNDAKGKGLRSALLTVPLSKTDPEHVLFGKMLPRAMEQAQVAIERLPDSPIRLFGWSSRASVWRLYW